MSYDISLKDPVTGKTLETEVAHHMIGGTYAVGGTQELWLNVTYNYGYLYYKSNVFGEEGIRSLYGKSGAESIPMLKRAIEGLKEYYVSTRLQNLKKSLESISLQEVMTVMEKVRQLRVEESPIPKEDIEDIKKAVYEKSYSIIGDIHTIRDDTLKAIDTMYRTVQRDMKQGSNISVELYTDMIDNILECKDKAGYWDGSAENATKPLHSLLAFAQMRPDGVWDGD